MPPVPQEPVQPEASASDRVVISGMSGLYPSSHNVAELSDILYNKVNPVSADHNRWTYDHPEASPFIGAAPDLELFDGQFFMVHRRLGKSMDPMARKVLEESYKAIYDAGLSPGHIFGKKIGVYIGSNNFETEKAVFNDSAARTMFGMTGTSKAMFANRISYWIDAKGPSYSLDQACCSSTLAIEQAYRAIKKGDCDAAIAGGCSLCLHPQNSIHYGRTTKVSMDGKTKSYDQNAEGFVRSEAIAVVFLQKAQDALRVYGEVVHIKNEFIGVLEGGIGPKYCFDRDPVTMANFIKKLYDEAGIPPSVVEYVEGFGSADPEADKSELEALAAVFRREKNYPLLLGSVTSNIGFTEAATGVAAITKVLLGYHKGELAGNLHLETPRQDVAAVREGRVKVLGDHHKFGRSFTAVNGLSTTGVNSHVLLHGNYKPKDPTRYRSSIPRLVPVSARTDEGVNKMIETLKSSPVDAEQIALLHNAHSIPISGHLGRGYVVIDTNAENETVSLSEDVEYFDVVKRPLVFVYSGMGSQWAGMGVQLMRIPIFSAAIERCDRVLRPRGIDIAHIITSPEPSMFDNILHSFVGIAAVQIGLTDVLRAVGLEPDIIIGHSVGELGCAYADGCFTAEEMILSAYSRGLVSVQIPFIKGSMAAVGIGYQKIQDLCPPEIEVACHNGPDSCTISGPQDAMKRFVSQLSADQIFAKEVPCSNIAYHSRYIAEAGPALLEHLSELIKSPKERSKRWLSSSVPVDRWDEPAAKVSSAEYHTNNFLYPVLFEETSRLLPANGVLVEIAPHGLLQAILKRSLPDTCSHILMTRRRHNDNALLVLEAIGKLYVAGYEPQVSALYPKVEFPVSTGTPFLSHLVHWMHSEKWPQCFFTPAERYKMATCKLVVSMHDDDNSFLKGNVIRGKTLYPYAAALVAVWDTLAMSTEHKKKQVSVQFTDIHLYAQPILHDRRCLRIHVNLHRGTGMFEVLEGGSLLVTGNIVGKEVPIKKSIIQQIPEYKGKMLKSNEVYQILKKRDYCYSGEFRSIADMSETYQKANIHWTDNWTAFIDGLLQVYTLNHEYEGVSEPRLIRSLSIDVKDHLKKVLYEDKVALMQADFVHNHGDMLCCGGIMMENVVFRDIPPVSKKIDLNTLHFVPRFQSQDCNITETLRVYLQILTENVSKNVLNIVDMVAETDPEISDKIQRVFKDSSKCNLKFASKNKETIKQSNLADVDLLLVKNLSTDEKLPAQLHKNLPDNTFILNIEEDNSSSRIRPSKLYRIVSASTHNTSRIELVKWRSLVPTSGVTTITVRSTSDLSMLSSAKASLPAGHTLVILTSYPQIPGLKELVTAWRKDDDRNKIFTIAMSNDAESQCLTQLPDLDLAFNVLNKGTWGGEYYLPCSEEQSTNSVLSLRSTQLGDLSSLRWVEQPELEGAGIPVTVYYCSFNRRDVKQALGVSKYDDHGSTSYALEFSGVTDSGERVMGVIPQGAASSRVLAIPELLWPVPEHWSLEDAATVPLAYALAYYCMFVKATLGENNSLFVHSGAGGLGQAVISVALAHGFRVFTTVSTVEKKHFLLKRFPGLQADNIGYSRDHTFADLVLTRTKGEGCRIVISCAEGSLKNTTLNVSGFNGITFDFSQLSNADDYKFGMFNMTKNRSYHVMEASCLFVDKYITRAIRGYIANGISQGHVVPLTRAVFPATEAARALRLLAAGTHRGRVVLHVAGSSLQAQPRIKCSPYQCHLVVTDDYDCGLQWVQRLVDRGAKKIQTHSLTTNSNVLTEMTMWQNKGVDLRITGNEDLETTKGVLGLLDNCAKAGPIEGVYVLSAADMVRQKTVDHLDVLSRKLCQGLKYFAVISRDQALGQQTCTSRAQEGLPAKKLILSFSKNNGFCNSLLDAIERTLRSKESVLIADSSEDKEPSIVDQIASVAEMDIRSHDDSTNLGSLGLSDVQVKAVSDLMRDAYSVYFPEEKLKSVTIKRLKLLESKFKESGFQKINGLENFFNNVDSDEILATSEITYLPTMSSNHTLRSDEIDLTQTFLCIVPGLEGHNKRFTALCERLKLPALVLQPGLDNLDETVSDTAHRYATMLLKKTKLKSNFYLMGYESGVLIALEMAAILEENGLTGTVYCIGASPEDFKTTLEKELSVFKTEDDLQDAVAQHMFVLMGGHTNKLLDLKKYSNWEEKIQAYVQTLIGQVSHSAQYAQALIRAAYARIVQVRKHEPKALSLRSQIVLVRAAEQQGHLQTNSNKPVIEYDLKAPLAYAADDLRCTNIINRHLDQQLLDAFNENNICESYLANPDTFMAYNRV